MAQTDDQVMEADSTRREPPANRPPLVALIVGLLAGISGGFLIWGVGPLTPSNLAGDEPAISVTVTTAAREGIGHVVPSFPDGLVAATSMTGRALELTLWPLTGPMRESPMSMSASIVFFDISGRRLAAVDVVEGSAHGVLYGGLPAAATAVATDVNGFAWHQSAAGELAYTRTGSQDTELWVSSGGGGRSEMVTRLEGDPTRLVAWGDWGFLLYRESDDVSRVLSASGDVTATHPGRVLASHRAQALALYDEVTILVEVGRAPYRFSALGRSGAPDAAAFSPDGGRLALLHPTGVTVVDVERKATIATSELRSGAPQVVWSTDGRFVLVPGIRGLFVLDTETSDVHLVLGDRAVAGAGVLPLRTP